MSKTCAYKIAIYAGPGAQWANVREELQQEDRLKGAQIVLVKPADIERGLLEEKGVLAFVLPGSGRSAEYRKYLLGPFASRIQRFVENGGSYYGICAGAFLACGDIYYTRLGHSQRLTSPLNFFDEAEGIVTEAFQGETDKIEHGFELAPAPVYADKWKGQALYWGGPKIGGRFNSDDKILARYKGWPHGSDFDAGSAAVVVRPFGKGRVVVTGLHYEVSQRASLHEGPFSQAMRACVGSQFSRFAAAFAQVQMSLRGHESIRGRLWSQTIGALLSTERGQLFQNLRGEQR